MDKKIFIIDENPPLLAKRLGEGGFKFFYLNVLDGCVLMYLLVFKLT